MWTWESALMASAAEGTKMLVLPPWWCQNLIKPGLTVSVGLTPVLGDVNSDQSSCG